MTVCRLIQLDAGTWWCPSPGCDDNKQRLLPGNYRRNCRSLLARPPLLQRWGTYRKARRAWKAAGKPVRSDAEVARIHDTLCVPCEFYDATWKQCRLCGCNLSKAKWALVNKIRMATTSCPAGKWGETPKRDGLPRWPPAAGERETHRCDVVIPYTVATIQWLRQSVESILNQNYAECVVHLVCDGPPIDNDPAETLAELPEIRWYRNRESVGPYVSVHRVWDSMETGFLAIQDSDDIALPNRIWYSVETLEKTGADILSAAMEQFVSRERSNDAVRRYLRNDPVLSPGQNWKFGSGGSLINGTMACRREAFETMNGFMPLACSADLDFPTRARWMGMTILSVPHVLALRRLHATSLSNGEDWGMGSDNRTRTRAHIEACFKQYDQPGCDFASFGGLARDRGSPDTVRLDSDGSS